MATRLSLYNHALRMLGERRLSSLTEENESRRLLDDVYDGDGIGICLEEGQWIFATRAITIDYDPDVDPAFGYSYAFSKPSDWVATTALCSDDHFRSPLLHYIDETGYWYSDNTLLYVKYISNDSSYGMSLANWPKSFEQFVAAHFAAEIAYDIGGSELLKNAAALRAFWLKKAKNKNAMALPTRFPAQGSWTRSRHGSGGRNDRGNNGSLIG